MPATVAEAAAMALALPDVVEGERHGARTWFIGKKGFAWERGFSKADLRRFANAGETPPAGPFVAVITADLGEKEAVLASGTKGFFTIAHFDRYPMFLIQLRTVGKRDLRAAIEDAWLAGAPPALADAWLASRSARRG